MLNKNSIKSGFSLLEMVIVIALIGIAMTIMLPSFRKKNDLQIPSFRDSFTLLLHAAYLNALEKNKFQKIYVDVKNNKIQIQEESGKDKLTGDLVFTPIKNSRFIDSIEIPRDLEIRNFYIAIKEGTKDHVKQDLGSIFFFITPDGIAQEVVINIVDASDKPSQPEAGLILNPFTLNFELYDTFQKPS